MFLIITTNCHEIDEFRKIRNGNFDIVSKGTYHGKAIFLREGKEYENIVLEWRAQIEKKKDVLPMITRKFFFAPEKLNYKFKFVTFDKEKNFMILRYFARQVSHPIYAGFQIQFVYDLDSKKLLRIYTAEVPLE
jgi:hypothetical protein